MLDPVQTLLQLFPYKTFQASKTEHNETSKTNIWCMYNHLGNKYQSSWESFRGLSMTRYGTVNPPAFLLWIKTSLSRLVPWDFFSSVLTNLHIKERTKIPLTHVYLTYSVSIYKHFNKKDHEQNMYVLVSLVELVANCRYNERDKNLCMTFDTSDPVVCLLRWTWW